MEYRLLCVYKCNKNAVEQVDIEVNRELHTSTLAPFNRNVSVEDLAYSSLSSPRELVYFLNQYGFTKQPFALHSEVLSFTSVRSLLADNPWLYRREGRGSLKKTRPVQAGKTVELLP